jgi:hypothetical protein
MATNASTMAVKPLGKLGAGERREAAERVEVFEEHRDGEGVVIVLVTRTP